MKTKSIIISAVLFAHAFGQLPSEVVLTNGVTLHNASVVRWEADRVVLKHAGGADCILYANIMQPQRGMFEGMRSQGLARQQKQKAIDADRLAKEAAAQDSRDSAQAYANKNIYLGEQQPEVLASLGRPLRSSGHHNMNEVKDQWVYPSPSTSTSGKPVMIYIEFDNWRVTGWTIR